MRVELHNLFFVVDPERDYHVISLIKRFCNTLIQLDYVNKVRGRPGVKAHWYIYAKGKYRFHIGHYEAFNLIVANKVGQTKIHISSILQQDSSFEEVDIPIDETFFLRDYQEEAIDFLMKDRSYPGRLLALGTGRGKSLSCLAYLARFKRRTMLSMTSSLLTQWKSEADLIYGYKDVNKEMILVTGAPKLKRLMKLALHGKLEAKFILMSLGTYRSYLKGWVNNDPKWKYPVQPPDLMKVLSVANLVIDEVHMQTHSHFNTMLNSDVVRMLCISATVLARDPFIKSIQKAILPYKNRYDELIRNPYIEYVVFKFHTENPHKIISTPRGRNTYSHIALEKYFLRSKRVIEGLGKMYCIILSLIYVKRRRPKDRALVLFTMVDMCFIMEKAINQLHPKLKTIVFYGKMDKDETLGYDIM